MMRNGISSSDPDAIEKLEATIASGEAMQNRMREANKIIRRRDANGTLETEECLAELGALGIKNVTGLFDENWAGKKGYPSYLLTNNNANVRRLKGRLKGLREREAVTEAEGSAESDEQIGDVRLVQDRAGNRVRLFFPSKPDVAIRTRLKRNGFRWAPSIGAWQAYLNDYAVGQAREIAGLSA